jgi:hypothetical protein
MPAQFVEEKRPFEYTIVLYMGEEGPRLSK